MAVLCNEFAIAVFGGDRNRDLPSAVIAETTTTGTKCRRQIRRVEVIAQHTCATFPRSCENPAAWSLLRRVFPHNYQRIQFLHSQNNLILVVAPAIHIERQITPALTTAVFAEPQLEHKGQSASSHEMTSSLIPGQLCSIDSSCSGLTFNIGYSIYEAHSLSND